MPGTARLVFERHRACSRVTTVGAALLPPWTCDPLEAVVRRDGGRSRKVGLVDRVAHQGHTPQGPLLGGLLPLRRVAPRRDLGDAALPDRVPGLTLVKAVQLHRRRRRQQGQRAVIVGCTSGGAALARPAAATTRTAPGQDPKAADHVAKA